MWIQKRLGKRGLKHQKSTIPRKLEQVSKLIDWSKGRDTSEKYEIVFSIGNDIKFLLKP